MDSLQIQDTIPQPVRIEAVDEGMILTFSVEPRSGWARVSFSQKTGKEGPLDGEVAIYGMTPLRFTQFVYP